MRLNNIQWLWGSLSTITLSALKLFASRPLVVLRVLTAPPVSSDMDAISVLFPNVTRDLIEACRTELLRNDRFFKGIDEKMLRTRNRLPVWQTSRDFLYMAVRLCKPQLVVETGVFDGLSSAVILQALTDNGSGTLISIDLPAFKPIKWSTHIWRESRLPLHCQPGWVIPDDLRGRHQLLLGDSKEILPRVLQEHPKIDVFLHDSLHTFNHQYFEYRTVWPHLSDSGLLLSDDIFWSSAFARFCKQIGKAYVWLGGFGGVRK